MDIYDSSSPSSIENYGKRLIGKTLRTVSGIKEIPLASSGTAQGMTTKGSFGTLLERFYYGITPPNDSAPDFPAAGVELKSTPLRKRGDGSLAAKERLVLNIINYMEEVKNDFDTSTFLKKNANILLVAYLHDADTLVLDYLIKLAKLIPLDGFSKEDQAIIRQDWIKITDKIRDGHADELSESDTLYLGACTKAATSENLRDAPGGVRAKPRAFSFKGGFMTTLMNGIMDAEAVVKDASNLKDLDFESFVINKFKPFIGQSVDEIRDKVAGELNLDIKGIYAILARRMMGVSKQKIEEFEKAEVSMKIIRLGADGRPREHMSFPAFTYMDIINEVWNDEDDDNVAPIKTALEKKFLFVVYQCGDDPDDKSTTTLKRVLFWSMPNKDLLEVKKVWYTTIKQIAEGNADELPASTDNEVSHVRPHAKDGEDKIPTPHNGLLVRKGFWLNKDYIKRQIV